MISAILIFHFCSLVYGCCMDSCRNYVVDCQDYQDRGHITSGVYRVNPLFSRTGYDVFCDMTTDGGGWLVFQRRLDGSLDFYKEWLEYEKGFGDPSHEYWLGLLPLKLILSQGSYELRIDLTDFEGNSTHAIYDHFDIGDFAANYNLKVAGYSGTAGDSLRRNNGLMFSTKDNDNDLKSNGNCATDYEAAWWYDQCHESNLNGYTTTTMSSLKYIVCMFLLSIATTDGQAYLDSRDCPTPPPSSPCHCDKDMVDCRSRGLSAVPTFRKSSYLFKEIRLGHNSISYIQYSAFSNINVSAIHLDNNIISYIHEDAFTSVSKQLKELDLSHNRLTTLPAAIGKLVNVSTLDVSLNPIDCRNFTEDVMRSIGDFITVFRFGDQSLSCWPASLHHFPQLEELSFFGGNMERLPHNAFNGFEWTLQKLWFKYTRLIAAPIALQDLKSLTDLHFDDNIFVGDAGILIPAFAGMTTSLNTLSLENNNLTAFPSVLLTLNAVHNLSIARNDLQFISDQAVSVIGRNNLTTLNLQRCNLNRIPGALSKVISLINLDLSNNTITTIEKNDLQKLRNLRSLNISYNPLTYISKSTFYDLVALQELILHDTYLYQVPEAVKNLPSLRKLDLTNIPPTIECNCNLQWLWCFSGSNSSLVIQGQCLTIVSDIQSYARTNIPMVCPHC